MASTGFTIAGAGANNADAGNDAWTNPGNITADDGSDAQANDVDNGQTTQYLEATTFGFAIPAGATIDGIIVRIQKDATDNNTWDHTVQLLIAGTRTGDNNADTGTYWPVYSPTNIDHGGAADLWGLTPDADDINHADFGVTVRASANNKNEYPQVDAIWMNIYYTEAASSSAAGGVIWFMRDSAKKLFWLPKRPKLWTPEPVLSTLVQATQIQFDSGVVGASVT